MVALISMILLKLTSEWSCDLFFLPKGYVDGALFTIIAKKMTCRPNSTSMRANSERALLFFNGTYSHSCDRF